MIKKILGLLILGLFSVGITFGYVDNRQCYSVGVGNGNNGYGRCYELDPNESFVMGNYTNSVKDFFNFDDLDGHKIFLMGNSSNDIWSSIWWDGENIKSFSNRVLKGFNFIGTLSGYCIYDGVDTAGLLGQCFFQSDNSKPNYSNRYYYYNYTNEEFINIFKGESLTKVIYTNGMSFSTPTQTYTFAICGIYENINKSFCFVPLDINTADNNLKNLYGNPTVNQGATTQNYVYENYGTDFSNSPLIGQGSGSGNLDQEIVGIALNSTGSAINYFENRYGRNESICYAGIDNVTINWGSSVSFQEGTGLNIFQVFSGINNMSPDLDKVYVRLNSRLINYEQWFGRSGDPLYLSNYNTGTNQVDLYYDNLTFPFVNNPVAVYFLASNISVHSDYSTMGSEIVSYCNLKINNGTFDEIIDQSVKNNITKYTEQSNKNNGLNPDGTVNIINYNNFGIYSGDAWVSSGVEISFTGNTTVKNSLKNFFDRINDVYNDINVSGSVNSILPNYVIYGLLLVILFKLLRRK